MHIEVALIPGVMLGFEIVSQDKDNFVVLDLLIVRLLFIY